jgi:hypothetical protein
VTARTRGLVVLALCAILVLGVGTLSAQAAPPANDNFSAAVALPLDTDVLGSTLDATSEAGEQAIPSVNARADDCATLADGPRCSSSVWYRFSVPSTGTYTIETCDFSTETDTVLGVWTGSAPGSLSIVMDPNPVSSDDECAGGFSDNGSQVSFTATSGTTYYVEVGGFAAAQGFFYLRAYAGSPLASPEPDTFMGKDNSYPDELLGGGPSGSGPRQTASFEFTSDTAGASFQCSFDGAPFAGCTSPVSLDGVTGTHSISVRAVVAGVADPTPAIASYTIDNSPPDTAIVGPPPNPDAAGHVTIRSQGTERAWFDTFRCAFDAQDPSVTSCGAFLNASSLCNGTHTFSAAFVDNANNLDPTPITTSFLETGGTATCAAPVLGTASAVSKSPTEEAIVVPFSSRPGAGGRVTIDYGTTTAYGQHLDASVIPSDDDAHKELKFLQPGTLYHYDATVTTSFGSQTTGDQTFTTAAPGEPIPAVTLGTPVVVGQHAAAIPITVDDPGASDADYGLFVDTRGPANPNDSPTFRAFSPDNISHGTGPRTVVIDLVDLEPGTAYHVVGFASENGFPSTSAVTPDISFTVPTAGSGAGAPPPPPPVITRFRLRAGFIRVVKIRHGSRTITLVIRHLPPSTSVGVTVNATVHSSKVRFLARGKAKANKAGVARVKMKLSRKARKVLRSKRTKSLSLKVRVKPPGQTASSITLHRKLKR